MKMSAAVSPQLRGPASIAQQNWRARAVRSDQLVQKRPRKFRPLGGELGEESGDVAARNVAPRGSGAAAVQAGPSA